MKDRELDLALDAIGTGRTRVSASRALRERVRTVPLQTPQRRSWLPQSPKWRYQSMFSAIKFLVAGAIVALFGGFLLSGVLTQPPSDDRLPAVGASASATTQAEPSEAETSEPDPTAEVDADGTTTTPDLLPGVDLVTEEVEPGVYRVLSDGTDNDMDLAARYPSGTSQVVAGQDGSVWVRDFQWLGSDRLFQPLGEDRLFRLGLPGSTDASRLDEYRPDISVAPDGVVWAIGSWNSGWPGPPGEGPLFSLADGEWTTHSMPEGVKVTGIETPADGSVWTSLAIGTGQVDGCSTGPEGGRLAVARLVDGEWVEEDVEPATRAGDGGSLAVGPDGTTLLGTTYFNSCPDGAWIGIMERTEDGWARSFTTYAESGGGRPGTGPIAIGSDGTVWAYQYVGRREPWSPRLLRRTDGDWEVLGDDESVPLLIGTQSYESSMAVSADGRFWVALEGPDALDAHRAWGKSIAATLDGPCAGVLSFDGASWTQHLAGACVSHVSAAPNGNVWATVVDLDTEWLKGWAEGDPWRAQRFEEAGPASVPGGLYVITPEAVAAAE